MDINNNVINEVFMDMQKGRFAKANSLLADDFKTVILEKEVGRPEYISAYQSLLQAIPDLKFNVQNVKTDGFSMTAWVEVSGTNTKDIPPLMEGWNVIPATNKRVDGLVTELEITLKGDKIEEIRYADRSKGMIASLFENLGMDYRSFN